MATGFWLSGRFVQGSTVRTAGSVSTSRLELEVAAAVARAKKNVDALKELRELLQQFPQLLADTPERTWNSETKEWEGERHLLTPLAELYAEQLLANTTPET